MLQELNQVGKREMLLNIISRVDAKNTPFTKMAPVGETISNTFVEWQADDFEDPHSDMIWPDGKDVDSFGNASENRGMLRTYIGKLLDSAMVSDFAEEVSNVAGLSKGERAESMMKKLVRLGRAVEALACSDLDTQQQADETTPYRFRGLGSWITDTAQTTLPVPTVALTPAASINTTAVSSLTETNVNDVLQSVWEQTGEIDDLQLVCGATLRRQFTSFATRVSSSNSAPLIRTYNTAFAGKLDSVVMSYNGDFGNVNIIPTLFNAHRNFGGSATLAPLRGYLFPTRLIKKSIKRKPRVYPIENRGGGERFLVDWVGACWVTNPKGCGKFAATSA